MDSKAYHFDEDDINVSGTEKSDGEVSSYIENHEEIDCKTLNYENELQSINQADFSEALNQAFDAKSKLCPEILSTVITPSTTSNPLNAQDQTFDHDEHASQIHEALKAESHRGSARLVRLQAASERPADHRPEDASGAAPESKAKGEAVGHQIVFSEAECRFVPSRSVDLSSNSEGNVLLPEVSYQPVVQSRDPNTAHISSTTYEQIVFSTTSDTTVSSFSLPRIEKVQSCSSTDTVWIVDGGERCEKSGNTNAKPDLQHYETSHDSSSGYQSPVDLDGIPDTQQMQRFITADNQVVYGYKDPNGEFHFFCPTMNERESHNEKERKRRSRVSDACNALRKMIPGMSEKTDKATVFEQASRYLKFLRDKFGTQFDQAYCEKYFQDRN